MVQKSQPSQGEPGWGEVRYGAELGWGVARSRRLNGETVQVEIMGKGQQVAGYGTHPTTMQPYTWPDREPLEHAAERTASDH